MLWHACARKVFTPRIFGMTDLFTPGSLKLPGVAQKVCVAMQHTLFYSSFVGISTSPPASLMGGVVAGGSVVGGSGAAVVGSVVGAVVGVVVGVVVGAVVGTVVGAVVGSEVGSVVGVVAACLIR